MADFEEKSEPAKDEIVETVREDDEIEPVETEEAIIPPAPAELPKERPPLSPEEKAKFDEEANLVEVAKTDQDAKTELVNRYLGSLYSIAKEYMTYEYSQDGKTRAKSKILEYPEKEDLVNASLEPFEKAVQTYDPSLGYQFHTYLQTLVRQFLRNKYKAQDKLKRLPQADVLDPETGEEKRVRINPLSLSDRPISESAPNREGVENELIDVIKDDITSRPDWQTFYDMLVSEVDSQLNSDIKKQVFKKLIEYGFQTKKLKEIREELGIGASALSNILGRDIYPAVHKVLTED